MLRFDSQNERPVYDWLFTCGFFILPAGIWLVFIGGLLSYIGLLFLIFLALLDLTGWRDTRNYSLVNDQQLSSIRFYRYFSCWQVLSVFVFVGVCGFLFCQQGTDTFEQVGLVLSSGICSGAIGITHAHELIHRNNRSERFFGGLALSANCYATFKVEHIRGHHKNVATENDASSARLGQSLYHFLPRAIFGNVRSALKLEAQRLHSRGLNVWHWKNELIGWSLVSLLFFTVPGIFFGVKWGVFFLLQALLAILVLETTNYVEHYGLTRKKETDGSFERVSIMHSWNSSSLVTNYFLINLQRHADHHVNPNRRYQNLRHHDESPQLPTGYAGMVLSALVPPWWRALMDKRVEDYMSQLQVRKTIRHCDIHESESCFECKA